MNTETRSGRPWYPFPLLFYVGVEFHRICLSLYGGNYLLPLACVVVTAQQLYEDCLRRDQHAVAWREVTWQVYAWAWSSGIFKPMPPEDRTPQQPHNRRTPHPILYTFLTSSQLPNGRLLYFHQGLLHRLHLRARGCPSRSRDRWRQRLKPVHYCLNNPLFITCERCDPPHFHPSLYPDDGLQEIRALATKTITPPFSFSDSVLNPLLYTVFRVFLKLL